jgi:hypothetical protein
MRRGLERSAPWRTRRTACLREAADVTRGARTARARAAAGPPVRHLHGRGRARAAVPAPPSGWPLLLALHVLVVVLRLAGAGRGARAAGAAAGAAQRAVRAVADWLPLLLIPLLYTELAVLNRAVHGGRYFDDIIIGWEQALFGGQPSRDWAAACRTCGCPSRCTSPTCPTTSSSSCRRCCCSCAAAATRSARRVRVMLSFFAHYLFFIFFPVQGPRYLFPPPGGELAGGFFYGSSRTAAGGRLEPGRGVPVVARRRVRHADARRAALLPRLAPVIALLTSAWRSAPSTAASTTPSTRWPAASGLVARHAAAAWAAA